MHKMISRHGRAGSTGFGERERRHGMGSPRGLSLLELALFALLVAGIAFAVYRAVAPAPAIEFSTVVRVEADQTLWDIASQHRLPGTTTAQTVDAIRVANGMEGSALRVGQPLVVPEDPEALTAMASR